MKILSAVMAALLFLLPAQRLPAADEKTVLELADMEKIFQKIVLQDTAWPKDDLVIENFSARPSSLAIPSSTLDFQVLQTSQEEHLGKKVTTIAIMVNGQEYERIRMSGDLQLYGDVLCTTKRLPRHALLSEEDITTVRRNIAPLDSGFVANPQAALGKRLKTALRPGAILYENLLEAPPLVQRGDLVTIVAESANIRITAPGEARNAGALGDLVKVKNLMSRQEIFAKVLGSGMVETEF